MTTRRKIKPGIISLKKRNNLKGKILNGGRPMGTSLNGYVNGPVNTNGRPVNGHVNGSVNGNVNTNGHVNGSVNGNVNTNGHVNGSVNGNVNGPVNTNLNAPMGTNGHVNGSVNGPVNTNLNAPMGTNGHVNGNVNTNGHVNGPVNTNLNAPMGTNGHVNGNVNTNSRPVNGHVNGHVNGPVNTNLNAPMGTNGHMNGPVNTNGRHVNGPVNGRPKGTSLNGPVNGRPKGTSLNGPVNGRPKGTNGSHKRVKKNPGKKTQSSTFKKSMATKIQAAFRGRLNIKIRPHFLSKVCPDSSECIMIGKNKDITYKFFDGFKNLKYLHEYEVINSGDNGSIFKIDFMKNGYHSYGAIKIASPINSSVVDPINGPIKINRDFYKDETLSSFYLTSPDNMIYEYLVGLYLNQYIQYLPNFLETYQLLQFNDFDTYKNILLQIHDKQNTKPVSIMELKKHLIPLKYENVLNDLDELKYMIDRGCESHTFGIDTLRKSYTYTLMTQYVKNPITLRSLLSNHDFNNYHLIYILFQIYFTLSKLNEKFVHYDLHDRNVLLYEPYPDGYIEYFYHVDNQIIQFKSKYIVKIIDYGRSYMGIHTKQIKEHILTSSLKCYDYHADQNGYYDVEQSGYYVAQQSGYNIFDIFDEFFIDYNQPNVSHDLRLMSFLKLYYTFDDNKGKIILDILSKVQYNVGIPGLPQYFGTEPNPNPGYPTVINNVTDAFESLKDGIIQSLTDGQNDMGPLTKRAEMHVYGLDRPYEFKEIT